MLPRIANAGPVAQPGSGLVLLRSQTIGSAVSSVTVTNAFEAAYTAYRIIIDNPVGSITYQTTMRLKLGSAASGYYGGYYRIDYNGLTAHTASNNAGECALAEAFSSTGSVVVFDINTPYVTGNTSWAGNHSNGGRGGYLYGVQLGENSFTDFTINTASGTLTGGTIKVYGYA